MFSPYNPFARIVHQHSVRYAIIHFKRGPGIPGPLEESRTMKTILNLVAVCCLVAIVGCQSTNKSSAVAPGAVGECSKSCEKDCGKNCAKNCSDKACCADKAAMGAVGEKSGCCKNKAADASMSAVGEKSGCCKSKAADASLGAMGDKKECCTKKSSCTKN